jgi:hypothetical protein
LWIIPRPSAAFLSFHLLLFSLRLARALFRDHYFYYFYFSKPDLSDFLDVKHLEYATGLLKNYTIVMAGASAFE